MKKLPSLKKLVVGSLVVMAAATAVGWFAAPASAQSACNRPNTKDGPAACDPFQAANQTGGNCDPKKGSTRVLGFPFWYEYLDGKSVDGSCRPTVSKPADIWLVVAALFQMLMRIAGLAAVGFIIFGGFNYIMSRGQPSNIAGAKDTITNAIIGLVITIISARLVGFIAGRFSGSTGNDFLLPQITANNNAVSVVLSIVFQLAAVFAVMFIAWGGITYARSNGDSNTIKEAKETIIYALIGLAVAIFAQAIVLFIFNRLD